MAVIGHHAVGDEIIGFAITVMQTITDDLGNGRYPQPMRAISYAIEQIVETTKVTLFLTVQ